MRWTLDLLIVAMLVGLVAGLAWHDRTRRQHDSRVDDVRRAVAEIQRVVTRHRSVENDRLAYPPTIEPEWFEGGVPDHLLLSGSRPWLEIASPAQAHLHHPPDRTARPNAACFWYNPRNGLVRARVPSEISDAKGLEMYNYVNGSSLASIFVDDR